MDKKPKELMGIPVTDEQFERFKSMVEREKAHLTIPKQRLCEIDLRTEYPGVFKEEETIFDNFFVKLFIWLFVLGFAIVANIVFYYYLGIWFGWSN